MNLPRRTALISAALAIASTPACLAADEARPADSPYALIFWPVFSGAAVLVLLAIMLRMRAAMHQSMRSIGESGTRGRKRSGSAHRPSPWLEAGRRMKSPPTDAGTPREPGGDDDENDNDFNGDSGSTDRDGGGNGKGGGGSRGSGGGGAYG